jgi:hypothetical protein
MAERCGVEWLKMNALEKRRKTVAPVAPTRDPVEKAAQVKRIHAVIK